MRCNTCEIEVVVINKRVGWCPKCGRLYAGGRLYSGMWANVPWDLMRAQLEDDLKYTDELEQDDKSD